MSKVFQFLWAIDEMAMNSSRICLQPLLAWIFANLDLTITQKNVAITKIS